MKLFFYGVLMGDVAPPPVRKMLAGLGPGEPAAARGTLYAVTGPRGAYPVLLPGAGEVHGWLHGAGTVDMAALDAFESVDPVDPSAGEYRREEIAVRTAAGSEEMAHAYLYNWPVTPALAPIPHGDFARWLAASGLPAFGS